MIHKRKFFFHSEWTGFDNSSGDTRYHQVCFLNTCIFEHLSANFESEDLDLIRHRPPCPLSFTSFLGHCFSTADSPSLKFRIFRVFFTLLVVLWFKYSYVKRVCRLYKVKLIGSSVIWYESYNMTHIALFIVAYCYFEAGTPSYSHIWQHLLGLL